MRSKSIKGEKVKKGGAEEGRFINAQNNRG
jgi:hypothetical protein